MTMKHFKLYLMLALLVAGVSGARAERVWVDNAHTTWYDTELGLQFSTTFVKSSSETINLTGNQVAVRIYCPQTTTVTDMEKYYASSSNNVRNWNNETLTVGSYWNEHPTTTASDDDYDDVAPRASRSNSYSQPKPKNNQRKLVVMKNNKNYSR